MCSYLCEDHGFIHIPLRKSHCPPEGLTKGKQDGVIALFGGI